MNLSGELFALIFSPYSVGVGKSSMAACLSLALSEMPSNTVKYSGERFLSRHNVLTLI